jgi:thymidine kinase
MVKLVVGRKGSGKTKMMVDMANEAGETSKGNIVFINTDDRLMYDLVHKIRFICMEEFPHITNSDEYIGFLYGIISGDHDIAEIFIDSILKHADFELPDLTEFIERLKDISKSQGVDFLVSISADKDQLGHVNLEGCEILN